MRFASRAIYGAQKFNLTFIDELSKFRKPFRRVQISKLVRNDLIFWRDYASSFNGLIRYQMSKPWHLIKILTDASFSDFGRATKGASLAGAWSDKTSKPRGFESNWLSAPDTKDAIRTNINFFEWVAACLPPLVWVKQFQGCKVMVTSDSTCAVFSLSRKTTKTGKASS